MSKCINLLYVEDAPEDVELFRRSVAAFDQLDLRVEVVSSAAKAYERLSRKEYDLCVVDYWLPDGTADELLKYCEEHMHAVPVVVCSGLVGEDTRTQVMKNGAADCYQKSIVDQGMLEMLFNNAILRHEKVKKLYQEASTDPLTGCMSRRYFFRKAASAYQQAQIEQRPLTALVIDVDYLKRVNDSFGHDIGDRLLALVGDTLKNLVRYGDFVGRVGGDEFILIADNCDMDAAAHLMARVQAAIARLKIPVVKDFITTSVTVGWATSLQARSLDELLKSADADLYSQKNSRASNEPFRNFAAGNVICFPDWTKNND